MLRVELIYDTDCPNIPHARKALLRGFSEVGLQPSWTEAEASTMIVSGFIEPLVKELPMEFAVEAGKLLEVSLEGAVG